MPTLHIRNISLNKWLNTIHRWKQTEDIHLGLNPNIEYLEKKIIFAVTRFRQENDEICKKYFYWENGDVKYEGEGENAKPCLLPGKNMEDYEKEIGELTNKLIEVKL